MSRVKKENPHIFHRQRLKERFLAESGRNFDDKTLLELLLSYALPRIDTRPIAAELLDRFGSLSRVFDASVAELTQVGGVKLHTAILLKSMPELSRRYLSGEKAGFVSLLDEKAAGEYLKNCFAGYTEERVMLLCLDPYGGLLERKEIHRGNINSAAFSMRLITETAIHNNCGTVILAHNHPNGSLIPSDEDIYTTQRVAAALRVNDIELAEHYIIAGDRYTPIMKNMPNRYGYKE